MNEKTMFTLITGASSGIGKAMAWECGSRKMNLLLVSLPGQSLEEVALQISSRHGVTCNWFETDLSEKDGPAKVFQWTRSNGYVVRYLVNNAGMAGTAIFANSDDKYIDDRILVNIRALVFLSRYFITDMKSIPGAAILNVGSLSAFYSIPFKSLYAASKAFVVNFSRAIRTELNETGISVSVLCPNGVRTNQGTHARIDAHGFMGRLTSVPVEKVAKAGIEGMIAGRFMIIPGFVNHILLFISKLIPGFLKQRKLYREFYKEVRVS
jgi:short-subunit dehydrogenase